jgi:hypothetical protein
MGLFTFIYLFRDYQYTIVQYTTNILY